MAERSLARRAVRSGVRLCVSSELRFSCSHRAFGSGSVANTCVQVHRLLIRADGPPTRLQNHAPKGGGRGGGQRTLRYMLI